MSRHLKLDLDQARWPALFRCRPQRGPVPAARTGISLTEVDAELLKVEGIPVVVVLRCDRRVHEGRTARLHQEDFGQALAVGVGPAGRAGTRGRVDPAWLMSRTSARRAQHRPRADRRSGRVGDLRRGHRQRRRVRQEPLATAASRRSDRARSALRPQVDGPPSGGERTAWSHPRQDQARHVQRRPTADRRHRCGRTPGRSDAVAPR